MKFGVISWKNDILSITWKVPLHICDTYYCSYLTHTTFHFYLIDFQLNTDSPSKFCRVRFTMCRIAKCYTKFENCYSNPKVCSSFCYTKSTRFTLCRTAKCYTKSGNCYSNPKVFSSFCYTQKRTKIEHWWFSRYKQK